MKLWPFTVIPALEYFSLEGEDVIPMAVGPAGKLSDTWGRIKLSH